MNKFLCIHGHFYQPPRENAWIEEIELQPTAHPYHDWNERISAECYEPNCSARIFDENKKIVDIVSNYSLISFNFGPTLLSWLQKKAPSVYSCILDADRESLRRLGHGNAIAQAYNHMILPLASEQDKETQVLWGLEDFRCRFKRDPEAMWLPETAADSLTLEVLHRLGIKFVILSPTQAQRVRPFERAEWIDVSSGAIDPRRAYRYYFEDHKGNKLSGEFIDLFFYDGSLSAGLSFGDFLHDASRLAERVNGMYNPADPGPQLIHAATDGETYGHHKKSGEMALAHAMRRAAEHYGFEVVNYGYFLERFPAQWEVELKKGRNNEGTAWSCSHGVGRWKEDCGCRASGGAGWNQRWRKPLREAMDILSSSLWKLFEHEGSKYFIDSRAARNAYIRVILERTEEQINEFFSTCCSHPLDEAEKVQALRLLEMQRHAMLMYTSCGWFFDEVSGLEATQIMQYADRALQLAEIFTSDDFEKAFIEKLSHAQSNMAGYGTGRDIFYRLVRPCRISMQKVLNHFVMSSVFSEEIERHQHRYTYDMEIKEHEKRAVNKSYVHIGWVSLRSGITLEAQHFFYVLGFVGGYHFRSVIRQMIKGMDFSQVKKEFLKACEESPHAVFDIMRDFFGDEHYCLRDMFHEERQRILRQLIVNELKSYEGLYAKMYDDTRDTLEAIIKEGLVVPWEFRKAAENTLSKRLYTEIAALRDELNDAGHREAISRILGDAREFGYALDLSAALALLSEILHEHMESLRDDFYAAHSDELKDFAELVHATCIEELIDFMDFVNTLPIEFNKMVSQNILYGVLREKHSVLSERARTGDEKAGDLAASILSLAEKLDFSTGQFILEEARK